MKVRKYEGVRECESMGEKENANNNNRLQGDRGDRSIE